MTAAIVAARALRYRGHNDGSGGSKMTYQEKLVHVALAVLAELKRIPAYHDEAEQRLRAARNGHATPAAAATRRRNGAMAP